MDRIITIFSDEDKKLMEVTVGNFSIEYLDKMKVVLPNAKYFIDWNGKNFGYIKDLK